MSFEKPLAYASLKCVLEQLEANLRIQLAHRCPSLSKVEKVVPLKLDHLTFGTTNIKINKTRYYLKIHKEYKNPYSLEATHQNKDLEIHDQDKYGLPDYSGDTVTPDDICIRHQTFRPLFYSSMERIEERLVQFYAEKKRRDDGGRAEGRRPNIRSLSNEELDYMMTDCEVKLVPYYYKKANMLPPFEMFLQLEIGQKQIHRSPYNMKLYDIMRLLCHKFLGGRGLIRVKWFGIVDEDITLRLPTDVKFKIRKFQFQSHIDKALDALTPIIDPTSFPLQAIKMDTGHFETATPQNYNHTVALEARVLHLNSCYKLNLQHLFEMRHRKIHVANEVMKFSKINYIRIIEHWISNRKGVDHQISFYFPSEKSVIKVIEKIKKHFGLETESRFVFIPIPETSTKIRVTYIIQGRTTFLYLNVRSST